MLIIQKGRDLRIITVVCCFTFFCFNTSISLAAKELDAREIVSKVEKKLWSNTSQGRYEMTITTAYWKRTLKMKVWMQRPEKSFIRILSPAKEAGVGSLRVRDEMWNYLPKVERTVKVPPSMMLQAWMGSDFTNDDLVKESSMIDDYTHELIADEKIKSEPVYQVKSVPKPNAAVVWGKLIYHVRKSDLMPLSFDYYDERGRLIKSLIFSDVREMDGRQLPNRWEMRSTDKPENSTVIRLSEIKFDRSIEANIFTLRNLRGR